VFNVAQIGQTVAMIRGTFNFAKMWNYIQ